MSKATREVAELQRWFVEVVTHPDGVHAGASVGARDTALPGDLDQVLLPSEKLSAADRVGVYAGMYFVRLIEVLEGEYPALKALLGEDAFWTRCREFIVAHPSRHPNLNRLGADLPEFLRNEARDLEPRAFLRELALLERGIQEVFDGPRDDALSTDDLLALPQERWGEARLRTIRALRLFAFEYPVNGWYQEWREGDKLPSVPGLQPSWLVLYRRDFRVWRLPVTPAQFALLSALKDGLSLGEALERMAQQPDVDLEEIAPELQGWFREWAGTGLFASVEL